ncbi:phosphotransferase [Williamsia sp.]|uniref:phosphotransferase n=1 Tax=Williamsia sp. TaxID=1872085 RepID=UPI002F93A975
MPDFIDRIEGSAHYRTLEVLADSDRALGSAPELAIDDVHRLEQIDRPWLSEALAGSVAEAQLLEVVDTDAHDGMTDRKSWSLTWNEPGVAAGLPTSVFAKATPHTANHRVMLSVLHMDEAEAKYYAQLHPENPGLAPASYYSRSYGGGRSVIILEDLKARDCLPYTQADAIDIEHARAITVALAKFHAKYWRSDRLDKDLSWVRPRLQRFGWPWLYQVNNAMREKFLSTATESELPPHARKVLEAWQENSLRVYEYWDAQDLTVIHGDSHLGNTYSAPDGTSGLFDWQVIFAAPGVRDLTYFLYSAFTDEQRQKYERECFDLYIDTLAEEGTTVNRENAWNDFLLFVLDRWDAGMMSFVHGTYGHARDAQLRAFDTVAGSVEDNEIYDRLSSLLRRLP